MSASPRWRYPGRSARWTAVGTPRHPRRANVFEQTLDRPLVLRFLGDQQKARDLVHRPNLAAVIAPTVWIHRLLSQLHYRIHNFLSRRFEGSFVAAMRAVA